MTFPGVRRRLATGAGAVAEGDETGLRNRIRGAPGRVLSRRASIGKARAPVREIGFQA
jgi:hypothetical protein